MTKSAKVECQVCGGFFSADKRGNLVHHGFKRPGWGYTVGRCRGAGRAPFPATDAVEEELAWVKDALVDAEERVAAFARGEVLAFSRLEKYGWGGRETRLVDYAVGVSAPRSGYHGGSRWVYGFEDALKAVSADATSRRNQLRAAEKFLAERIEQGRALRAAA